MAGWRDRRILDLFGVELPILQAPMAGAQGSELAIAVSEAGGLGALPCALLSHAQMESEMTAIRGVAQGAAIVLRSAGARSGDAAGQRQPRAVRRDVLFAHRDVQAGSREFPLWSAGEGAAGSRACDGRESHRLGHHGGGSGVAGA